MIRMVLVGLAVMIGYSSVDAAGGSEKEESPVPDRRAEADRLYNQGLKHRDKAWEYEAKAEAASKQHDREVYRKSAQREFLRAIDSFKSATVQNSRHYEAFSSLGYAQRRTGRFQEALMSYDRALKMSPDYAEALEYRAETYLGLNRLDDALEDYRKLVALDKELARQFLAAANKWLSADGKEAPESFVTFIAAETETLGPPKARNW